MPLNIDIQQIFLHLFNFIILGGGLYLLLYKPVKNFMEDRTNHYEQMDAQAKECLKQAQLEKEEYDQKLKDVQEEMNVVRQESLKETEAMISDQVRSAKEEAEQIVKVAKINAEREKKKAVEEAKEEITQLALEATKKIMNQEEDDYHLFVEAANTGDKNETK